jgi:tRNA(Ile)-lysidine synthase
LAHQLNDRAETVAAAVLDAAGTFALGGIPPVRGRIIRPLFDVPRQVIEGLLVEAGIDWRRDSSNLSRHYQRNHIRLDVLPKWERENPGIVPGLARLGEQVWSQQRFLERSADRILQRAVTRTRRGVLELDARRLSRYDAALDPHVLRLLVDRIGLDIVPRPTMVARFGQLRRQKTGSGTVEQGGLVITRSQQTMRVASRKAVTHVEAELTRVPSMPRLETRIVDLPKLRKSDDRLLARFDFSAVVGELEVRWPRRGDRYQPLGLNGTKELSDLFADRKVPIFDRGLVPLVVDHQGILWPVGHPIAHRARLTNRTRRVLEARVEEESWKSRS